MYYHASTLHTMLTLCISYNAIKKDLTPSVGIGYLPLTTASGFSLLLSVVVVDYQNLDFFN